MNTFSGVYHFVPVLGSVTADRFNFSLDAIPEEQIPNPYAGKQVFALRVVGDCMEPTFRDGEYIYMSVTQPVTDGKVVLALLDGEHTVKRYFKTAAGIELRPDNPKYKPRTISTNKLQIVAVAVGRYGKL
jgi:repressor LexA